jgi:hypothetical protein
MKMRLTLELVNDKDRVRTLAVATIMKDEEIKTLANKEGLLKSMLTSLEKEVEETYQQVARELLEEV